MKILPVLAACALSALALAACGSSSSGSSASASSSDARDTARLKLQECLRKQGVDAPRLGGGGGQGGGTPPTAAQRQKLQTAIQGACKKEAQGAFGNQTDAQRQEFQDAFAKFSSCMRQHGVDLPNFTPGQGPPPAAQRLNRNTPKFKAAQEACRKLLPQGGRFGGGGPGPGGGGTQS
jgi:hypothetical protein